MPSFPAFMKKTVNRIAPAAHHTPGVEGCVFDGADGSQMTFWECSADATTAEHVHEFDEYVLVVEGSYALTLDGRSIHVRAGEECFIPRGTRIAGKVTAGTRTIHMFGGHRADRATATGG